MSVTDLIPQHFIKKVETLSVVGGSCAGDRTRRVARKIIAKTLAAKINFCGKLPKIGLQSCDNVVTVITGN